jgi:hypothetical protein
MRDTEKLYSRPSLPVEVISVEQAKSEIPRLRRLNQELTGELFQYCCEIERDSSSLDPERLSILVVSLEMVSKRLRRLEYLFGQG